MRERKRICAVAGAGICLASLILGSCVDGSLDAAATSDGVVRDANQPAGSGALVSTDQPGNKTQPQKSVEAAGAPMGGDFNGDGSLDLDDLDPLVMAIAAGTNDAQFDLNGDGVVDANDLDGWLATAGAQNLSSGNPYLYGDANLDGSVDGLDFIAWNSNKFTSTAAWSSGDFNADGFNDGLDFIIWNTNKFQSS